ncbi:hypothetical protein Zmor_021210 [Zophobas morio]|uniref:Uncharacterized protein n=1 Tax=Zophobas morio TaxID=2755281 RepID=A0AA38I503_9CUCU|nr:hypothetical protein Zmor_021210 [Zophobas morio]
MARCIHTNFIIDERVDRQVKKCFEEMVQYQMTKLDSSFPEELKRRKAVEMVLIHKEKLKIMKKKKIAKRFKTKPVRRQKKTSGNTGEGLLKYCLLKQHQERQRKQRPGK